MNGPINYVILTTALHLLSESEEEACSSTREVQIPLVLVEAASMTSGVGQFRIIR